MYVQEPLLIGWSCVQREIYMRKRLAADDGR